MPDKLVLSRGSAFLSWRPETLYRLYLAVSSVLIFKALAVSSNSGISRCLHTCKLTKTTLRYFFKSWTSPGFGKEMGFFESWMQDAGVNAKLDGIWGFSAVSREFWLTRFWQTGQANLSNCNQKLITKLCCDSLRQRETKSLYGELPPRAGWMWGAKTTDSTAAIKKRWLQQGGIFPVVQDHQGCAHRSCPAQLLIAAHREGKTNYLRDKQMPRVICKTATCLLGLPSKLWRRAHLPSQLSLPWLSAEICRVCPLLPAMK